MMFLNEPTLMQAQQRQGVDQVKILWQLHEKQMSYHDKSKLKASNINQSQEANEAIHKEKFQEVIDGRPQGFSAPGERPKDFDRFQTSVRNQIRELTQAHADLKNRYKEKSGEIEEDMQRIDKATESLQSIFNEFATVFNSFVQREMRLETLHK